MSKLVFNTGKEVEFPYHDWDKTILNLKTGGLRMTLIGGVVVPLNSQNIQFLEKGEPPAKEEVIDVEFTVVEEVEEEEEKELTPQEKQDKLLEEMKAKSDCKHPPEKQELHFQDTKTGRKYFNVCSFCGIRSRFIAMKDLQEQGLDLDKAKEWVVK